MVLRQLAMLETGVRFPVAALVCGVDKCLLLTLYGLYRCILRTQPVMDDVPDAGETKTLDRKVSEI